MHYKQQFTRVQATIITLSSLTPQFSMTFAYETTPSTKMSRPHFLFQHDPDPLIIPLLPILHWPLRVSSILPYISTIYSHLRVSPHCQKTPSLFSLGSFPLVTHGVELSENCSYGNCRFRGIPFFVDAVEGNFRLFLLLGTK